MPLPLPGMKKDRVRAFTGVVWVLFGLYIGSSRRAWPDSRWAGRQRAGPFFLFCRSERVFPFRVFSSFLPHMRSLTRTCGGSWCTRVRLNTNGPGSAASAARRTRCASWPWSVSRVGVPLDSAAHVESRFWCAGRSGGRIGIPHRGGVHADWLWWIVKIGG